MIRPLILVLSCSMVVAGCETSGAYHGRNYSNFPTVEQLSDFQRCVGDDYPIVGAGKYDTPMDCWIIYVNGKKTVVTSSPDGNGGTVEVGAPSQPSPPSQPPAPPQPVAEISVANALDGEPAQAIDLHENGDFEMSIAGNGQTMAQVGDVVTTADAQSLLDEATGR